jgi:type IV pilus assembly protein PilY1
MNVLRQTLKAMLISISIAFVTSLPTKAGITTPAQVPLFVAGITKANVMLLLDDSGSMKAIAPGTPFDSDITYSCPSATTLDSSLVGTLTARYRSSDGYARFQWYQPDMSFGGWGEWGDLNYYASNPQYCFDPGQTYSAYLEGFAAEYSGNYLNWYFGPYDGGNPFGSGATRKPAAINRIEAAQLAANQLLDSMSNVRVGVAGFNGGLGARIHHGVADLATHETTIRAAIDDLTASNWTPLAEALHDIGRYFTGFAGTINPGNQESACTVNGQYDGTLTLHPGGSVITKDDDTVFHDTPALSTGVSGHSPICYWCQKNFVVLLTDGEPYYDNNISADSGLRDYDGDCAGGDCEVYDRKSDREYGTSGSDYLDDVAQALYELDLRPDIDNLDGESASNNVVTYTVGFAIDHPLLSDTAEQSGGLYFTADSTEDLNQAFADIARDITDQIGAAAGAGFSSSAIEADSMLFLTQFNSSDWSGDLLAFDLAEDGSVSTFAKWSAKETFVDTFFDDPTSASRVAYSWNPILTSGVLMKNTLDVADLVADYQTGPDGASEAPATDQAAARLAYLLGSRNQESSTSLYDFRARNPDSILGDIVHSKPVFVGDPQLGWPDTGAFDYGGGKHYSDFKSTVAGRPSTVYAGGNDGALHGFDANTGVEVLAYYPAHLAETDLETGYHYLTDPDYSHRYFVDGSPVVGDAFIKGAGSSSAAWRTVLLGTDRAGGRGLFALDVTDPDDFTDTSIKAAQTVLWEFSHADDTNLGYTFSEPTIALLNNGKWAAIVGNGYGNTGNGHAELFVLYLDGGLDGNWTYGSDYLRISTASGSPSDPDGLSTPAVIDLDADGVADRVYAGSLHGGLWAFDLSSTSSASWGIAHGSQPLFHAINPAGDPQPITTKPQIARHPSVSDAPDPNVMVLFGTGQYLVETDKASTDTQSFYGVWDRGTGNRLRTHLQAQSLLSGTGASVRLISENDVNYSTDGGILEYGWYLDLEAGERVVSDYLVRAGIVYFNTQIPDDRPCAFGGSGWLMSIKASNGSNPDADSPQFDLNDDGEVLITGDTVSHDGSEYAPAGEKFSSSKGLPAAPAIIGDKRYTTGTQTAQHPGEEGTQMDVSAIAAIDAAVTGRMSWDQLKPQ